MCISKKFCFDNLPILFKIMESERDSLLMTNSIISLGDIASRFPNLAAPHISRMFAPLHHAEMSVRKNTLLVISHLILNDMIKVKEFISEIALAVTDEKKSVRDLAKLFFQEFSKKGKNPVYNVLPDIVSKFTHDKVEKTVFETVLKELIRYISEEKQQENLIIKICSRFSKLKDDQHILNNVYCLTLLNYGEKCIKKLIEMSRTYKGLLGEEKVFEHFKSIVVKAKKSAIKQEVKEMILEFEKTVLAKSHLAENSEEETPKDRIDENVENK
ncbi:hypothetical protein MHBO_003609 [Bonamia ostreae]|uniref:Condensin complex subunit 1 C-terminal domain-containing protein n=1 Tax=Bonamia ostreae TaxID=126728 RepID=A0ABV2AR32_9EUKA